MDSKTETCSNCRWWEGNDMHPSLFGIPCMTVSEKFGPESTWTCRNIDYQMTTTRLSECETVPDFGCIHWQENESNADQTPVK